MMTLITGLLVLRPSISSLLQSAIVCYYKVRQVLLQSATGITKCDDYYKVRQYRDK